MPASPRYGNCDLAQPYGETNRDHRKIRGGTWGYQTPTAESYLSVEKGLGKMKKGWETCPNVYYSGSKSPESNLESDERFCTF